MPASGPAPAKPRLALSSDKVVVTAFKPSDDGKAWIVRLFGASGKAEKVKLAWANPAPQQALAQRHQREAPPASRPLRRGPRLGHRHVAGGIATVSKADSIRQCWVGTPRVGIRARLTRTPTRGIPTQPRTPEGAQGKPAADGLLVPNWRSIHKPY